MFDIKTCFGQADEKNKSECSEGINALQKKLPRYKSFCMPGHKGELGRADLTELDGGDIFPSSSIVNAEKKASEFYKVKHCRFLVGGASAGIKASVMAVDGDIIAPSFTHRSVREGTVLSGKKYLTFNLETDEDGLPKVPTVCDYYRAIKENPTAVAVVVTSPDYFGRIAPVKEIASLCEKEGKLLIADCAHGAHFASRTDLFSEGGEKYAHFAVVSTHKTLRALTQSAIGVVNSEEHLSRYNEALSLIGTTSPSYLLLSSIESAIEYEKKFSYRYDALVKECNAIRKKFDCVINGDPLRLVVKFKDGKKAFDALVEKGIMPEAYYEKCCVFIVTLSDKPSKIRTLKKALEETE
jgi:lysine decarboxylase